jgi:hypothetical protein
MRYSASKRVGSCGRGAILNKRAVASAALMGFADASRFQPACIGALWRIAEPDYGASDDAREKRMAALRVLSELTSNGLLRPGASLASIDEMLRSMRKVMALPDDQIPHWKLSSTESTLISLAQAAPGLIKSDHIREAIDMFRDEHLDLFSRRDLVPVISAFGQVNAGLAPEVMKQFLQIGIAFDENTYRGHKLPLLPLSVIDEMSILAISAPKAATAESLSPLAAISSYRYLPVASLNCVCLGALVGQCLRNPIDIALYSVIQFKRTL